MTDMTLNYHLMHPGGKGHPGDPNAAFHPGEMLREDFLPDFELTVTALANALRVSRQTVNELIHERRAVSPAMALRLSQLFGNSAESWLNAQRALDLWDAQQDITIGAL